ncbi:cation channel sperm-associated protein 4-like [Engraulis encrasicolus]|uniref:cation channel sperm-associated protein 4-like n=1 Tax=Engraulis encrasicolus TaxID=184585 RepID=UPI002FD4FF1F
MEVRRRSLFSQREYERTGRQWSILGHEDNTATQSIKQITECEWDETDTESYVSNVLTGALLEHITFKCLILFVIFGNSIIIALQTSNPVLTKKYEITFTVCEHIILTVFTWEILVKWYYGFGIFWRHGWNILDCVVTLALLISPEIFPHESGHVFKVMRVLRVVRCVSSFATMHGVAMMLQVIWQSLPDLTNIFLLLSITMMIFAVFGVTLFSTSVPSAFGDLTAALFSLFICITQDGWMDIYVKFSEGSSSLLYGGSLYFFIFLTIGAFVFGNLFGAVVTTNLEMSMADENESTLSMMINENALPENRMTHVEEVLARTSMSTRQKPWKGTWLESLRMENFEELVLVLDQMQRNMKEYKSIRRQLESIVDEVHSLPFNLEQDNDVIMRDKNATSLKQSLLSDKIATGRQGDMLSTLMTLEKAHVIDSLQDSPSAFQKGLRHTALRRASAGPSAPPPEGVHSSSSSDKAHQEV